MSARGGVVIRRLRRWARSVALRWAHRHPPADHHEATDRALARMAHNADIPTELIGGPTSAEEFEAGSAEFDERVQETRDQFAYFMENLIRKPTWSCSTIEAQWCPNCGDCLCDDRLSLSATACPLHGPGSTHPNGAA